MPYITREDGERFVIPSYRDVLSAKNKSLLKKDILMLSHNYGEYITLQRKGPSQYEVAFSPDTGYLLGETIWHYFKRPMDMIYCEAIPNTTEAILVIVKNGSVYLDGSFPLESIPEELIIFLTQKNNFEIYLYGDVPISQTPEEGKFSFEASSVKSFIVLDAPVFQTLPLLKIYQLQLVEPVLKAHGIGVFPLRQLIVVLVVLVLLYLMYSYLTSKPSEVMRPLIIMPPPNPYQGYNTALNSPAPEQEMEKVLTLMRALFTMPGWMPSTIDYKQGLVAANIKSNGGTINDLNNWLGINNARIEVRPEGIFILKNLYLSKRPIPKAIYYLQGTMAIFVDKLSKVYPGNHITINEIKDKGSYKEMSFTVDFLNISPVVLTLIQLQLKDLPFVLQKLSIVVENGSFTGSLSLKALGS